MQQTLLPKNQTGPATIPPVHPTLGSILAAHPIEAELQTTTPRNVVFRHRHILVNALYTLVFIGGILLVGILGSSQIVPFLIVFCAIIIGSQLPEYFARRKQYRLLMGGKAVPAVITQIVPNSVGHGYLVSFTYVTTSNPRQMQTIHLSSQQVESNALQRLKPFTLLVNPQLEQDVLPYFLVDSADIKGTAHLPLAQRRSLVPARIAAEPGVEAELYCVAPRRIIWQRNTGSTRTVFANIAVCVALGIFYLLHRHTFAPPGLIAQLAGLLVIVFLLWGILELRFWKSRFYLRYGYAVPATVEKCERDEQSDAWTVRFHYLRKNGEIGHGYLTIANWQKAPDGMLSQGATFTILRHPSELYSYMAYFETTGVDVAGGRSTQFTAQMP